MSRPHPIRVFTALLFAIVGVAAGLSGCAIVVVQVADQNPRLSAYPFGVKVERGPNDAVSVDSKALGLSLSGCAFVVGYQRCDQIRVDARTCGVAVIEKPDPESRKVLARIADQVRAVCLKQPQENPK